MATLVITNLTANEIPLPSLSKGLAGNATITTTRPTSALPAMADVIAQLALGTITVTVTPTAAEIASGLLAPPQAVQAGDVAPIDPTTTVLGSPLMLIRKSFAIGTPSTPDDVEIIPVNTLPFKFRVVDSYLRLGTVVSTTTGGLWTRASGAGTHLGTYNTALASAPNTLIPSGVAVPGALDGLFLHRGDAGVAGELFALIQREV